MAHQEGKKRKTLLSFFKPSINIAKRHDASSSSTPNDEPNSKSQRIEVGDTSLEQDPKRYDTSSSSIPNEQPPSESQRIEVDDTSLERDPKRHDTSSSSIPNEQSPSESQRIEVNDTTLEREPGKRDPIWKYPVNQRDVVRRLYIEKGAYQPYLKEYKKSMIGGQYRRFQSSWFKRFHWLEYSPSKDAVYCFPCFLFENEMSIHTVFTVEGFSNWKKVNDGSRCAFLKHVGGPTSPHNNAVQCMGGLKEVTQHVDKLLNAQSAEEIQKNGLRLTTTIDCIRWLAFQACAFRGHNEAADSKNRGNFIELLKYSGKLNNDIDKVILENAPQNAMYTSPKIQKEILHIFANKVRNMIREEVGDAKFSILVDEARDESNKEQMAIILRFVDVDGYLRERFFAIVHVPDTTAATLKEKISNVLSQFNLQIQNMRGQGYDGASNMRGAWNGLQALFLRDCPYAYYIHCFAHRLQLALVAAAGNEYAVWDFFSKLTSIVNLVSASPKRHFELQSAQAIENAQMIATGERETGRGANQNTSLCRAGATRWSSHFDSICSLVEMYGATCKVLNSLIVEGAAHTIRAEATGALKAMRSFEFIFVLNLMHRIMGITNLLCKALQCKSVDILNAMDLVSTTKTLLQTLREDGWDALIMHVESFCRDHSINLPEMGAPYKEVRSRQENVDITFEHYYHFDIFNAVIDYQLSELNSRFNDGAIELLILSSALDPSDGFKSFKSKDICSLAEKFYCADFTNQEMNQLRSQLIHYELDIPHHQKFQNLSTISELCIRLAKEKKSRDYHLIDRLIRLVLTLPVSTATTELAFSAMNLVKSTLRNKMGDEFLADSMVLYIEKEFAENIDSDSVIDDFYSLKDRRVQLK